MTVTALPAATAFTGASVTEGDFKTAITDLRTFIAEHLGTDGSYLIAQVQDFRLTLTTGVPVTTSDVTGATTIYACPYKGKRIALYDGAAWVLRSSAEFSLALSGLTSGKPYDVFCYDNAGTPTLEALVWTDDTTRATALAYQDGILVKSGAATRRYLGTFYATGTTTTEDSETKRYLWNYDHRARRHMRRLETTATWNYSTASWRQANASTSNQLNFVIGVAEDAIDAAVTGSCYNSATSSNARISIGLDSTSAEATGVMRAGSSAGTSAVSIGTARLATIPAAGRHYVAWLEYDPSGAGTTTWYGNGSGWAANGITGTVFA